MGTSAELELLLHSLMTDNEVLICDKTRSRINRIASKHDSEMYWGSIKVVEEASIRFIMI
jgi:hypothetical protein